MLTSVIFKHRPVLQALRTCWRWRKWMLASGGACSLCLMKNTHRFALFLFFFQLFCRACSHVEAWRGSAVGTGACSASRRSSHLLRVFNDAAVNRHTSADACVVVTQILRNSHCAQVATFCARYPDVALEFALLECKDVTPEGDEEAKVFEVPAGIEQVRSAFLISLFFFLFPQGVFSLSPRCFSFSKVFEVPAGNEQVRCTFSCFRFWLCFGFLCCEWVVALTLLVCKDVAPERLQRVSKFLATRVACSLQSSRTSDALQTNPQ